MAPPGLARAVHYPSTGMSLRKGITTWVFQAGHFRLAYRCNMRVGEAVRTFHLLRGAHTTVAVGPFLAEW